MLNLAEYRHRADRLADHLPWAALIAPGVILNKDGSFLRVLRFRGPDLESATEGELISACARANNVLKRFGTGWALFFDAERRETSAYPDSEFPDAASWLVDQERRAAFLGEGEHYESRYHLTLTWLPTPDSAEAAGRSLVERPDTEKGRDWHGALTSFIAESDRALDLFASFMPEVRALDDGETLTFLHGTISPRQHVVAVPATPIYLDALLADTPLGEAASQGRAAAWNALNRSSGSNVAQSPDNDGVPAWASAMRGQQTARHHRQIALHTLQQGDRGGASATPDIKERD